MNFADKEGKQIVFSGYKIHKEFKYGILHCFNREADIYLLEEPKFIKIYPKSKDIN